MPIRTHKTEITTRKWCLVLSYLLNFAYGFQWYDEACTGTTMYWVVLTVGLVVWAVVALIGYFREDVVLWLE